MSLQACIVVIVLLSVIVLWLLACCFEQRKTINRLNDECDEYVKQKKREAWNELAKSLDRRRKKGGANDD